LEALSECPVPVYSGEEPEPVLYLDLASKQSSGICPVCSGRLFVLKGLGSISVVFLLTLSIP